jgi:excisionase family DNA binding protein
MRSDLLSLAEAAEVLHLKPSTMRAWVFRRRIPFVKMGRRVLFRRSDLDALIAQSVVPASGEHPGYRGLQPELNAGAVAREPVQPTEVPL